MIIRERVFEARLASKLLYDPALAREFGIEIIAQEETSDDMNLDNRIPDKKELISTEA